MYTFPVYETLKWLILFRWIPQHGVPGINNVACSILTHTFYRLIDKVTSGVQYKNENGAHMPSHFRHTRFNLM